MKPKFSLLLLASALPLCLDANVIPNADFTLGDDGKEGWNTFLNVFDPTGANYKFGTSWDTGTAAVADGTLVLSAHPGWTDNGNGPADLGDVIENNFYVDFGGTPEFAGETVTFSGTIAVAEELDEGTRAQAFIKILDGSWGLAGFLTVDAGNPDGTFSITTEVPVDNMNAFQVGFLVTGPAGAAGSLEASNLNLRVESLLPNPDFSMGEDGKEGWVTFLNVFDPTGANYKFGTSWDTGTAVVDNGGIILSAHPGWTDNGNGPADLGDVIENNFYADFGGSPDFAGEYVTFSGTLSVESALDEGTEAQAFIKVLDGSWGLAEFLTADAGNPDGTFSLSTTVPMENMNAFQVGFLVRGPAGAAGSLAASNLKLEVTEAPPPLPWDNVEAGEQMVSPEFGHFEVAADGWIRHGELSWLYVGEVASIDSMWMFSLFRNAWIWTSMETWPVVYDASEGDWVFFFVLPDGSGFVFDYASGTWSFLPVAI